MRFGFVFLSDVYLGNVEIVVPSHSWVTHSQGTASSVLALQVEVHWSGYTAGYQGKRIDNTSVRDEPYRFRVGSGQVST